MLSRLDREQRDEWVAQAEQQQPSEEPMLAQVAVNEPSSLPRPILPNFPVLARACPRYLERSHLVLTSPSACSEYAVGI